MIARLIRWLAAAELAKLRAELAEIRISVDAAVSLSYVNGYNVGRVVGHAEMLSHLRGDVSEPVTIELMARRAAGMVH